MFVYVSAGSINEKSEVAGISHMLEHMLFKHTKKYKEKELLEDITLLGGVYNAVTDRDTTFFYIMTHMDNYKKTIDILHEVTRRPVFTQRELDMERKVVFEEIKKHKDSNSELYNLSYLSIMPPENRYARPVEGTLKSLKNITVSDLNAYFEERYKNVVVSVNCDYHQKSAVEKYLGNVFGESQPLKFTRADDIYDTMNFRSSLIVVKEPSYQYSTHVLFPSFPRAMTRENVVLNFVRYCLAASGLYSILSYELRSKRGLVYTVNSLCETYRYIGVFRLVVSTSNKDTQQILSVMLDALNKIKKIGLSPKVFKYYKKGFVNEQKYALTNEEFRTIMHSESLFYETDMKDTDYLKMVQTITESDVIDVSRKIFDFTKIGILTYGPYKSEAKTRDALESTLQKLL